MAAPSLELSAGVNPPGSRATCWRWRPVPALITIPQSLLILPDDELTFLVARALGRLRGGLALVDAVTSREAREVEALLRGASAALAGRTPPELPLAIAAPGELTTPDPVAALVGTAARPRVAGDLLLAEEALAGWEGYSGRGRRWRRIGSRCRPVVARWPRCGCCTGSRRRNRARRNTRAGGHSCARRGRASWCRS